MRLLMYLGSHPERLCTIAEIARVHGISEPNLMKITHRLARAGWIETIRGKNGGMRLARDPAEISLGAVVRDTENDLAIVACMGAQNPACILTGQCGLTGIMQGALDRFPAHLDSYTLADILPAGTPNGSSQRPLTRCARHTAITVSSPSPSTSETT